MDYKEIAVESLLVDPLNPRHDEVEGQREAILALLDKNGAPQLLRLAADIAAFGPSPIELALVVPQSEDLYVVVEGNRRLAAVKLLKNPTLLHDAKLRRDFQRLAEGALPLTNLACMVAESREEARRWIELRHNGAQQGVGIVGWSPEMQVRFTGIYSGQRGRALLLTDALEVAYATDDELLDLIGIVKAAKITTLGRLVSDPDFRKDAGVELRGDEVLTHYSPSAMRPFWHRLFKDLASSLTVSSLKSKGQRAQYLEDLEELRPSSEHRRPLAPVAEEPEAGAGPGTGEATAPVPTSKTPRSQRPRPLRLFHGLQLAHAEPKVKDLLREAQRIDLALFPNAGALLIRVLMELAVSDAVDRLGLGAKGSSLKDQIRACLRHLDPSGQANEFAAIRKHVGEPDSPLSVRSMQAYLHNLYLHPDAASLRAISENYMPMLRSLDDALSAVTGP